MTRNTIKQNAPLQGLRYGRIRVFVSSPGDVEKEVDCLRNVIEEINRVVANKKQLNLELVHWKTHIIPDMGRAQQIINQQIGLFDIFIGIMWKKFGTQTGKASSGTEEEFNLAYELWKKTGRPRIMFYFNQAPYTLRTINDVEQIKKVIEFRKRIEKLGLIWEYEGLDNFERTIRGHLISIVQDWETSFLSGKPGSLEVILRQVHPNSITVGLNIFGEIILRRGL